MLEARTKLFLSLSLKRIGQIVAPVGQCDPERVALRGRLVRSGDLTVRRNEDRFFVPCGDSE